MNNRRPTDAQVVRALAIRIPAMAPDGLRERIVTVAEATPQVRPVPLLLSALFDADPIARRRNVLVTAALLIALTLAAAAFVGSRIERQPLPLQVDPPDDLSAYVESAYLGLADLPAFRMVGLETGDEHVIYSDGSGTIRDERLSTKTTRIVSPDRSVLLSVDPDDRRTLIDLGRTTGTPGQEIGNYMGIGALCEGTPTYLGLETIMNRPAHNIRCGDVQYWIDVETRIVLRTAMAFTSSGPFDPLVPAGPTAASGPSWEVTELQLGPQPVDLFSLAAPDGYTVVRADDPSCLLVWFAECVDPVTNPGSPRPYVTPPPAADSSSPPDLAAMVDAVSAAYAAAPGLNMVIESTQHVTGDPVLVGQPFRSRHFADGAGRFRTELSDSATTTYITTGDHIWISYRRDDGSTYWMDDAGTYADHGGVGDIMLGFDARCETGWRYEGDDLVLDRPAIHIACDASHFWIDRERSLILRSEFRPTDTLERLVSTDQVVELEFREQPPELFDLPEGADVSTTFNPAPS